MTFSLTNLLGVSCPVCGNACADAPLNHYTVAEAAAHFCPPTRNHDRNQRLQVSIRKLWQAEECVVLRCETCGFAFGYPFISGDEEFYSILHEQYGYPTWRWDYDIALEKVTQFQKSGRVLDIGAGTGQFLKALGGSWERYAIEGSDVTRRELEKLGIQVFRDLAVAAQSEAKTFSVITLFQVLEHIADFRQFLKHCHQLLQPGGIIIITVPSLERLLVQEKLTGCPDMPPNHINKWTEGSLSHILRDVGFTPESALFEPSSWKKIPYVLQLKVSSNATRSGSIAAQVNRVPNIRLRRALLALLGLPAFVQLSPHMSNMAQGEALAMVGIAP
jgi:2-polyprenyl-3-methyl-5-hydroxy-6-metoxy-1,4-benzoquinol methylase